MKKILGIDYGDKRIGLALAEQGSIAVPYSILDNDSNILSNFKNIIIYRPLTQYYHMQL